MPGLQPLTVGVKEGPSVEQSRAIEVDVGRMTSIILDDTDTGNSTTLTYPPSIPIEP